MTPAEALAYLHQLSQFGFQPGLDSTRRLAAAVGLTREQVTQMAKNSFEGSFLGEAEKAAYLAEVEAYAKAG